MTYPMTVLAVATLVSAILLIHVVPQFQGLFAGVDAQLPGFTLAVISLSEFMQHHWWVLILVAGTGFAGLRKAYRSSTGFRHWLDASLLKAPVAGTLLKKSAVARYARTLSTTFAAGVPLVQALDSVAGATGNGLFKQAINRMRHDVSTGTQLNESMAVSGLCALTVGFLFGANPILLTALCIVWGVTAVADSAQFSASVMELSEPELAGTMVTVQTSIGFLLTIVTIQLTLLIVDMVGWRYGFTYLAAGPLIGIIAMLRLRRLPEARKLAGGRR